MNGFLCAPFLPVAVMVHSVSDFGPGGGGFGGVLMYEFCGKSMKQVLGYIPWLAGYPSPRPRKISIDMEAVVSAWVGCALRSLESGQTTLL